MGKEILFNDEARKGLKRGIDILAEAVTATLGPKGRNVVIDRHRGVPVVTKDGVSVAKQVESKDIYENVGIKLIREAASKTNDTAGDGTTSATLLAQKIVHAGLRNIDNGVSPISIKNGLEKASAKVIEHVRSQSVEVKDIEHVASISANDPEIGKLIAKVIKKVGDDGVVMVQNGETTEMEEEYVMGMEFDRGYASPYMITDIEKLEAVLEKSHILITDKKIETFKEIAVLLEKMLKENFNKLVIICDDINQEVLAGLVANKMQGKFLSLVVRAPGYGDRKKANLKDIAVVTGGKVISQEAGDKIEEVEVESLGYAEKVVTRKNKTTIIDGAGEEKEIKKYAKIAREEIKDAKNEFDKEKLRERLARLLGGIGIIKVGGATETEVKEKRDRVEDALAASRAAQQEGVVAGGGMALLNAREVLKDFELEGEEQIGVQILRDVLSEPIKKIAENAGKDGNVIIEKLMNQPVGSPVGYNASTDAIEDLVKAGVVDPVKVVRISLQNAVSAANAVIMTQSVITDEYEEVQMQTPTY